MARPTAHDIFGNVQASARREMERSSVGLFFSGLSAGLNMSFGFMAAAAAQSEAPYAWKLLLGTAAYPLGFLLVILSRAQLFTEHTLTPILLVLEKPGRRSLLGTVRIWGVVLLANLVGAFIAAYLLSHLQIGTRLDPAMLREVAMHSFAGGWGEHVMRGIFGAWLVALLVWMLHAGTSPLGEAVLTWFTTSIIYLAGFNHSVAGAVETFYLANVHAITYLDWAWAFQLPVTLGNALGGVVFVALVNYAQAVGAGRDVEQAQRRKEEARVRAAMVDRQAAQAAREQARREEEKGLTRKAERHRGETPGRRGSDPHRHRGRE